MKRQPAFTLVEVILYLGLFNIVFFAVILFTMTLSQNNRMAEYRNAIEKDAIFVSEHLNETFTLGATVDEANTIYTENNGKIRVTYATGFREYQILAGTLTVYDGTNYADLTSSLVSVSSFYVEPVRNTENIPLGARIRISYLAKKYPDTVTKTVQTFYAFR